MRTGGLGRPGPAALVVLLGTAACTVGLVALPRSAAVALVGLSAVVLVAVLEPLRAVVVIAFLAAAVPKAGVRTGSLPVPFLLFALLLGLLLLARRSPRGSAGPVLLRTRTSAFFWVWIGWVLLRCTALAGAGAGPSVLVAFLAWTVVPAVVLVTAPVSHPPVSRPLPGGPSLRTRWGAALEVGTFAACLFAVVQEVAGIGRTTIPGVTLALHDSYEGKNLALNGLTYASGGLSKIPSSYQNGNVLGETLAFFLTMALVRILRCRTSRRDYLYLLALGTAVLLSGSRTALIASVVGAVLALLAYGNVARKLAVVLVAGVLFETVVTVSGLGQRFSLASVTDTGGGGRSEKWTFVLQHVGHLQLLVGSDAWADPGSPLGVVEGWVGVLQEIGLVGVALLVALVVSATAGADLRVWRIPLAALATTMVLDATYLVFPVLFVTMARLHAPLVLAPDRDVPAPARAAPAAPVRRAVLTGRR